MAFNFSKLDEARLIFRILVLAIIANIIASEMPVHYRKLSNFVVTKLDDGSYFYKAETGIHSILESTGFYLLKLFI